MIIRSSISSLIYLRHLLLEFICLVQILVSLKFLLESAKAAIIIVDTQRTQNIKNPTQNSLVISLRQTQIPIEALYFIC